MAYILNILVGVVKVWNLAQKNSYASCFVMLEYVLYPLFRSWCGIDSTGFVSVFLLKNQRRKRTFEFELTWKVFSVLKPPFVSVPVSVLVKKNLSSRNLISRWRRSPNSKLCPTVTLISSSVRKVFSSQALKQVQTQTAASKGKKPFKSILIQKFFSSSDSSIKTH